METKKLNDSNAEYVSWSYEDLQFVLLGGIRIEGLQSMRLTLKIDFKRYPSIRHSLDLYNEAQTDKLVKKVAERFTLSTAYVHAAIGQLTDTVEDYRLNALENAKQKAPNRKPELTEAERKAATDFLKSPGLLALTNDRIGDSGVIGEEENRLIMYLAFTSRKMQRPLHIISFGGSAAGKSHLQEKVGELIPAEERIELTSVSGNAFYYYAQDDLGHKLVLIEDYDGVLGALYPLRELQSKQRISKTITVRERNGEVRTLHLTVQGPVSIGGCTTSEKIYEDNANRSFLLYLDESAEQDERVMAYQRRLSAGKVDTVKQQEIQRLLQNAQRLLQPVSVRNPYAESLVIPREVFKPKRSNAHYLAFIETITFYKQYQREHQIDKTSGEVYVETSLEDIAEANTLMKGVLLKKADELGYAARNFLEQVKEHVKHGKQKSFLNKALREALKINPSSYKMYMSELISYGYVRRTAQGNQKQGYRYEVVDYREYEQLQSRINTALDEALDKLTKQVNGKRKS